MEIPTAIKIPLNQNFYYPIHFWSKFIVFCSLTRCCLVMKWPWGFCFFFGLEIKFLNFLSLSLYLCTILGYNMCFYERILPEIHAVFYLKLEKHNFFSLLIAITYKSLLLCILMVPYPSKRSVMKFGQVSHGHVLQGSEEAEFMIVLMHHSTPIPH